MLGRGRSREEQRSRPSGSACRCRGPGMSRYLSACSHSGGAARAGRLGWHADTATDEPPGRERGFNLDLLPRNPRCPSACWLPNRLDPAGVCSLGYLGLASILTLSALINFLSQSPWERFLMGPAALLLAALSVFIAHQGTADIVASSAEHEDLATGHRRNG